MSNEILNFSITIGGIIGIIILFLIVNFIKKTTGNIGKGKHLKVKVRTDRQEPNKSSKCGNEIEKGMVFCDKCGTRIN